MRFAHVQQHRFAQLVLERVRFDLHQVARCGRGDSVVSAEIQRLDFRSRTAQAARRISIETHFANARRQRIDQHQTAGEHFADPQDYFERLAGLPRADDSREHAEHAAFGAGWRGFRRRGFGIETAIARSGPAREYAHLAVEAEDRSVDVGPVFEKARIVD